MNLRPILSNLFPENSQYGECGLFARLHLADINPIGNSYSDKKKSVDMYGIRAKQLQGDFRIGDVIVTSEGTNWYGGGYGHVTFINNIVGNKLYLTESNFNLDQRIHHGRTLLKDSSKIYGVIRRQFKFKLPDFPIKLNIMVLMNHEKQWNNSQLLELGYWLNKASGGKLECKITPLYTFNALKNWWYKSYGTFDGKFYNVIAREYIEQQALPLRYPDTNFLLWCIPKKQWNGSVFNDPWQEEKGWYYLNSMPGMATIVCDEDEISPWYNEPAFVHFGRHEISHWLANYGNRRGLDKTHTYDFISHDLSKIFEDMEWDFLAVNL